MGLAKLDGGPSDLQPPMGAGASKSDREIEMTDNVEGVAFERQANIGEQLQIQPINFEDTVGALQSMLAQAEALLGACRLLVTQTRDAQIQLRNPTKADPVSESQANNPRPINEINSPADDLSEKKKTRKRPYTRYNYLSVDVDLLQIFKSRLPGLGIGPMVVLITLLENHGRMVPSHRMRAAIGTDSRDIIKVYVSRLRNLFRSHGVDVDISVLHGGYGIPRGSTQRIMAGFGFDDEQVATATRLLHSAKVQSESWSAIDPQILNLAALGVDMNMVSAFSTGSVYPIASDWLCLGSAAETPGLAVRPDVAVISEFQLGMWRSLCASRVVS